MSTINGCEGAQSIADTGSAGLRIWCNYHLSLRAEGQARAAICSLTADMPLAYNEGHADARMGQPIELLKKLIA
jgi:hypothetical protein